MIVAATGDALQDEAARVNALAGERVVYVLPDNGRDLGPVWPESHYGDATPESAGGAPALPTDESS